MTLVLGRSPVSFPPFVTARGRRSWLPTGPSPGPTVLMASPFLQPLRCMCKRLLPVGQCGAAERMHFCISQTHINRRHIGGYLFHAMRHGGRESTTWVTGVGSCQECVKEKLASFQWHKSTQSSETMLCQISHSPLSI